MRSVLRSRIGLSFVLVAGILAAFSVLDFASVVAAPPPLKNPDARYFSANDCATVDCHAQEEPKTAAPYMQEASIFAATNAETGLPVDLHGYAHVRLTDDERSGEIMEKLNELEGTSDDADLSPRCLNCHSVALPAEGPYGEASLGKPVALAEDYQAPNFNYEEGVSCEACHGPYQKWDTAHRKQGWTREQWKDVYNEDSWRFYEETGRFYTKDLVIWASTCVRCHLAIDTNLRAAGHPDTYTFEAAYQSRFNPPHWRNNDLEVEYHGVKLWQTGQAAALQAAAAQLAVRAKGDDHNKAEAQWIKEAFSRLWAHWIVFRHPLKAYKADKAAELEKNMTALKAACAPDDGLDFAEIAKQSEAVANGCRGLVRLFARAKVTGPHVANMLKAIATNPDAAETKASAEVTALSLYSLWVANWYQQKPGNYQQVEADIYALWNGFNRKADFFDAEAFGAGLAKVAGHFEK